MRPTRALGWITALAGIASTGSCGDAAGPSSPGARSVEIVGPATLAPGQSAQYTLVEHLSTADTRPAQATTWTSSDPSTIQITSSGVATAQRIGEAVLSVRTRVGTSREIVVSPANTYRLVGRITDADAPSVAISDARVEIVNGPSAMTNSEGSYRLYGVPRSADVRVTGPGYQTHQEVLQLSAHSTQHFKLKVDTSAINLSGDYRLSVEAAADCTSLSADLRQRSYDVSVTQNGSRLSIVGTEPRFTRSRNFDSNQIYGSVTPQGAVLYLEYFFYYYYYYAAFRELLSDGTTLIVHGRAAIGRSAAGLIGWLDGFLTHATFADSPVTLAQCRASTLSLSPR